MHSLQRNTCHMATQIQQCHIIVPRQPMGEFHLGRYAACNWLSGYRSHCLCFFELYTRRKRYRARRFTGSRGSWVPALVVGLLSLLAPCVDIYYLYMVTFAQIIPETSDRIPAGGSSIGLQYGLPIAARVFLLIAEFTVMCTTWYYTRSIKLNNRRGRTGIPLATALQRDGTAAFIILFVLNILQVFTIFTSVIAYPVFSSPLSSIVISHFLLDLREADGASLDTTTFQGSVWSARAQNQSVSLQFNRPHSSFVGDMGASLDYGYDSSDMMANWSDETEDVDDAEVGTLLIGLDEHQPWAQSSRNMAENTSADAVLVDG
ncbi:hypothetical protein OBBRIDRAFT_784126 [Obba rivulosa]|uniref:Uncharacterized protein n=1 Tax=Obba rivulosa TaxID=1052685 RepID=A0A8E2APB6_9APHY|nr:hypothetical protein OBBRIDRAFT_784126 [Obba rivulosa]